jgi:multidrug transporter EmrE-like cation transporter
VGNLANLVDHPADARVVLDDGIGELAHVHAINHMRNYSERTVMNFANFTLVLVGVLLNAAAQLLIKSGTNVLGKFSFEQDKLVTLAFNVITEYHIVAGLFCYVISVGIWIVALSKLEVSVAYPMLSIGYLVNALAAWYLFGEVLSLQKIAGIFIIIFGVIMVARS